jgi:beta-lactamase regulating signal transducer with metallopeptidase domain
MLSLMEASVTAGVLILTVTALRALLMHRLPKGALLALWAVVLLRLLVPVELPSPTSVYSAAERLAEPVRRAGVIVEEALDAKETKAGGARVPVPAIVWAAGAALCAAGFIAGHARGLRRYAASLPVENELVREYMAAHRIRRKVQVRYSDRVTSPLTYGVLHPVILLPKKMDWGDGERIALILTHEMAHIRRFDALSKWALALALCLHWFNPMVWVMFALANRDLELSCDEMVVRRLGPEARAPYARALVEMEERRWRLPLGSAFSRRDLEERIVAIMKTKKMTVAGVIAAVVLVAAVSVVFATNASRPKELAQTAVGVDGWDFTQIQDMMSGTAEAGTWAGEDYGLKVDPKTGRHYTQKQYDAVMGLKTAGYEKQSIASFNRAVHAAFEKGLEGEQEDSLYYAMELLLMDMDRDDPDAPFLLNTLQASLDEYSSRLDEVYRGKEHNPAFTGSAERTETADVYGEAVEIGRAEASYSFSYRILDQDGLTVGERDQFLTGFMAGVQEYLNKMDADTLYKMDEKALGDALKREMDRLGAALSNEKIKYTGAQLSCTAYRW